MDIAELEASLLQAPLTQAAPPRPSKVRKLGWVLASAFFAFHATVLIIYNFPAKGLAEGLRSKLNRVVRYNTYMRTIGSGQSWNMFAPNPYRTNNFLQVRVTDASGQTWDMQHDIYGNRGYPYLFYDRMGKVTRRVIEKKGYRRDYAAWICRDWERTNGEPARRVELRQMWTHIPQPEKVIAAAKGNPLNMGYDPMSLPQHEKDLESYTCRTLTEGQLSPEVRERLGIEPGSDYRATHQRTCWDRKGQP